MRTAPDQAGSTICLKIEGYRTESHQKTRMSGNSPNHIDPDLDFESVPDNVPTALEGALEQTWDGFLTKMRDAAVGLVAEGYSTAEMRMRVAPRYHCPDDFAGGAYLTIQGTIEHVETGEILYPDPSDE